MARAAGPFSRERTRGARPRDEGGRAPLAFARANTRVAAPLAVARGATCLVASGTARPGLPPAEIGNPKQ